MKIFFFFCVSIMLIHASNLFSTENPNNGKQLPALDENANLNDYLQYASLSNPRIKAALNRWKSAVQKIPQARSLPDLVFYYMREDETQMDPRMHKIGFSQSVPWLPKLFLRKDIAEKSASGEYQKYLSEKNKLFFNVKKTYFELYYVTKSEEIILENIQLLKNLENVITTQYETGKTGYSSLIKLHVELGELENRYQEITGFKNPLQAQLNDYLNRPSDTAVYPPKKLDKPVMTQNQADICKQIQITNPDLKEIEYIISARKSSIKLANQNFFPDLDFGMGFMYTRDKRHDSVNNPATAVFSVNLPLWADKYIAMRNEEKENYYASLNMIKNTSNNLISELKMALYNFNDSIRKIDLYSATLIPKGEQSLNVTMQDFSSGKAGFIDFIDSERLLLEFKLQYFRSLADANQYLAQIEMLTGKNITEEKD